MTGVKYPKDIKHLVKRSLSEAEEVQDMYLDSSTNPTSRFA